MQNLKRANTFLRKISGNNICSENTVNLMVGCVIFLLFKKLQSYYKERLTIRNSQEKVIKTEMF